MTFLEETLGDKGIRRALIVFTLIVAIGSFFVVLKKDEMSSGPVYSLLTGETSIYGNLFLFFS